MRCSLALARVALAGFSAAAASGAVFGCSATQTAGSTGAGADGGSGGATSTGGAGGSGGVATTGSVGGGGEGGIGGFGGQGGGVPVGETEVFGHSGGTLYKLDPVTKDITVVGNFQGCNGSVIDIAIDAIGGMVGSTFGGLYKIDKATAACTHVKDGSYPNSLSFVPAGTLDANVEALVGFEGSTYVRIYVDGPNAGDKETIGTLNGGYVSSGDVVSVIGGGTYLTAFGGPENCSDCIIEVDPKTGGFVKTIGKLDHSAVFGLAFWGGAAYGFDDSGALFEINLTNGATTLIPQPNAPGGLSYYGAGSSTAAPLEPPE